MLNLVKLALRISTTAFDEEIQLLIDDCMDELQQMGVFAMPGDNQIKTTVIAYCKWKFGDADNKDEWEKIYHTKLAQLKTSGSYKTSGRTDGVCRG